MPPDWLSYESLRTWYVGISFKKYKNHSLGYLYAETPNDGGSLSLSSGERGDDQLQSR